MRVRAELTQGAAAALGDGNGRDELAGRIAARLTTGLMIRVPVELLEPGTLPPTVFKARRVVDQRAAGPA